MDKYRPDKEPEIGRTSAGLVYLGGGLYEESKEVEPQGMDESSVYVRRALDNFCKSQRRDSNHGNT